VIERLLRDGVVYALAAMFSRGVAFLLVPIYTRVLSPSQYGALELILTAGMLVTLVVALEVGQGMAREWAEQSDAAQRAALASTALTFTVLAHAAFLAVALAVSAPLTQTLLASPDFTAELRAGLVFIAINAVFLQLQNQFRWDLRVRSYAAVSALYGALTLLLGAWLGRAYGLGGVLWGQALAAGLSCATGLFLLRSQLRPTLDRRQLRLMLRFSLPLVPSGVAIFLSFYVNRLILSAFADLPEVGVLGVGQRVASVATLLIVGLQGALMPLVYRHHHEPGVPAQMARIFEAFVAAAMLACLALTLFARELIGWLVAPEFSAAASLLPWLAPAALLSQMYIFAPGIAIARKTAWQLALTSLSAAVAVALNLLLIPRWGAAGAAAASFAAAALFLLSWVMASQRVYALPLRRRALAATTVVYIGLVCLGQVMDRSNWSVAAILLMKFCAVGTLAAILHASGLPRWRRSIGFGAAERGA